MATIEELQAQLSAVMERLDGPETNDFLDGVRKEAAYQVAHWGTEHDAEKSPEDWLWLIAFLSTKALQSLRYGDREKARHHTISTAAACLNWHSLISGGVGHDVSNPLRKARSSRTLGKEAPYA